MGRRQHQRVELAVRRRHHHHQRGDAGDPGRHRIHQHRGRIGGGAAGNVEPDRFDRAPAPAEFDAERIGEALVLRQLPAMETLDAVAGEFERVERFGVAGLHRGVDLGGGDAQGLRLEIEPVEFARRLDQRRVAARGHVVDDGAGGGLDIGRHLALGREKARESLSEIGAAAVEANGHGGFPAGHCSWRGGKPPSTLCYLDYALRGGVANKSASSRRTPGPIATDVCVPPGWGRDPAHNRHRWLWVAGTTMALIQAPSPEDSAPSPPSLVPRSSVPRSVSSHSRHSTSSRSTPPWLNSSTALPPGASPG